MEEGPARDMDMRDLGLIATEPSHRNQPIVLLLVEQSGIRAEQCTADFQEIVVPKAVC